MHYQITHHNMLTHKTTGNARENFHALIQLPLYDQNIGIWCVINANCITGPILEGILDAQQYINKVIHFSLIWHLQKKEMVILCIMTQLHAQLTKLSEHYVVYLVN
jgi:hypothetical protein